MAFTLFDSYLESILGGAGPDLENDTIKVALIDGDDVTPDAATHDFYNDISAGAVGTPQTIGSIVVTDGTVDGDNVTFSAVSGDEFEYLVLYQDTGDPATSPLIGYFDSATGLPATPNGADIDVNWNASGIFRIGS